MSNTALITGASSGIGATYADRLAQRGHDLLLVARDTARLEALARRLARESGRRVDILAADLTDPAALRRVEARLRGDAAIGMLVNNAGMAVSGTLAEADPDQLERMVLLNALAPMRLAAAAVPAFLARGGGTIINIASVLALAPEQFNGVYSATKGFMLNLTQSMQTEAGDRLRIQAVLPGATRTEIWGRAGVDMDRMPAAVLMDVGEMVDAALAGLDMGEAVTIPALPETADWDRFTAARLAMGPNLSRDHAAARYRS